MITNVAIIRQSIAKVTEMLAGMSITVTQRGDGAYVQYDKRTGKPKLVNIPHLPEGASEKLIGAVQGFLDHEVAHILFTDPAASVEMRKRCKGKSARFEKRLAMAHNMTEDCYIERRMSSRFKGSAYNLSNVRKLVFVDRAQGKLRHLQADTSAEEIDWFSAFNMTMFRAWAGHEECQEFMDEHDIWNKMPTVTEALYFFESAIKDCDNSFDTLDLAERVLEALKEMFDPKDESDSDEDEDGDEGGGEAESESSDSRDEDGEGDSVSKSDEGDESDEEGSGSSKSDEDGSDDTEDSGSSKSDGDEDCDEAGGEEGSTSGEAELFLDAMSESVDFEESMKAEITAVYSDEASSGMFGRWITFSDEFNKPKKYEVPVSKAVESFRLRMENDVDAIIAPTAKHLERLLLAKKRQRFEPGRRSGRLHSANLHRLQSNDPRVFRKKFVDRLKNTAVFILVDMSGSMHGGKMTTAGYTSYALASMLQRVDIPTEVMTFTTKGAPSDYQRERAESERRLGIKYSQKDVCDHKTLKSFNERMNVNVVNRFAHVSANKGHMWENCDPESVKTAAEILSLRQEERKVLMVLSDGHPAFPGDVSAAEHELKRIVKEVDSYNDFEVVGVGIEDASVSRFYPKNIVLNNVSDLPSAVIGEMKHILLG